MVSSYCLMTERMHILWCFGGVPLVRGCMLSKCANRTSAAVRRSLSLAGLSYYFHTSDHEICCSTKAMCVCVCARGDKPLVFGFCANSIREKTGAAARESLQRDRPIGLTSPGFYARGSASIFCLFHAYAHSAFVSLVESTRLGCVHVLNGVALP